jgi:hypothetical protein
MADKEREFTPQHAPEQRRPMSDDQRRRGDEESGEPVQLDREQEPKRPGQAQPGQSQPGQQPGQGQPGQGQPGQGKPGQPSQPGQPGQPGQPPSPQR